MTVHLCKPLCLTIDFTVWNLQDEVFCQSFVYSNVYIKKVNWVSCCCWYKSARSFPETVWCYVVLCTFYLVLSFCLLVLLPLNVCHILHSGSWGMTFCVNLCWHTWDVKMIIKLNLNLNYNSIFRNCILNIKPLNKFKLVYTIFGIQIYMNYKPGV